MKIYTYNIPDNDHMGLLGFLSNTYISVKNDDIDLKLSGYDQIFT